MTLLFDLDGTLADPLNAFRASLEHAFDKHALTRPSEEQMRRAIGPPLHLSVREILGAPEHLAEAVLQDYREHHLSHSLQKYILYPGVVEKLESLSAKHTLFVATSKPHEQARPLLKHLQIAQYFREIYGSELNGERSQKAELISYILSENQLDSETTTMLGDRSYDMLGASANGVRAVGALWGYGSETELREAGAAAVFRSWAEVDF